MKKEITLAVMATILLLQIVGSTVSGFVGDVARNLSEALSSRIQVERILSGEETW